MLNKSTYKLLKDKRISFLFLFFLCSSLVHSQTKSQVKKSITAQFLLDEVEFKDVAVMSNVLKVKNNNGKNYTFNISINLPSGWKTLNNQEKQYTLKPNDSVFVPVRVIASEKKAKGGTKYSIAAYVNTNEGKQMAFDRFVAGRPKVTNWQMQILPRPRIYLLNGENEAQFQLNLSNEGDEPQDILVSLNKIGKGFLVQDSAGTLKKKNYFETTLPPYYDTTINYKIKVLQDVRNQNRVDVWGYNPSTIETEKRYGLFIRGSEIRFDNKIPGQKGKKADFVKLSNSIDFVKLNSISKVGQTSGTIPLIMFVNLANILGHQPILMLNFQGNAKMGRFSSLNYQAQTGFNYFKYSNEFIKSRLNFNLGYSFRKGFFGFNSASITKTFMAGYNFTRFFSVFGTYSRETLFKKSNNNGFNLGLGLNFERFTFNTNANIGVSFGKIISNSFAAGSTFKLSRSLTFGLNAGRSESGFLSGSFKTVSESYGFNLSKSFRYYSILFTANNNNNSSYRYKDTIRSNNFNSGLNHNIIFKRGSQISLNSNLNIVNYKGQYPSLNDNEFMYFNNTMQLNLKRKYSRMSWSPSFFFNYSKFFKDTLISGGGQINFSKNNYENLFYTGLNIRMAYNQFLSDKQLGIFFTSSVNLFARYKVWNFMGTYNYGGAGVADFKTTLTTSKIYTQMVRLSVGHQYQFKNKHLVLENNPTYTYINTLKKHGLSVFSQLYYFTNSGYRFAFNAAYNVSSGFSYIYNYKASSGQNLVIEETDKRTTTNSFVLGMSIKKDFSIPVPKRFRKLKSCDAKFVVFLDVNGNKMMDMGEVPVENVVLRMNDFEVITDDKGMASFLNMTFQRYKVQVFPLTDMGSWFPNVDDSVDVCGPDLMYIPFSKGVQVMGGVELDREAFTGELFDKLDVSRFKIFLIDTTGKIVTSITDNKGNFNFYVPYSKYTLKFDEKALGNQFYLAENDIALDLTSGIESYYHNFLIIERKRKVKRKIFGPDGKVTYVEEEAGSKKSDKDKQGTESDGQDKDKANKDDQLANNKSKEGRDGKDGMQSISIDAKMEKLDSLINVLNQLILRAATRIDVRTIVKQEMQDLIDELNASFTIRVDELPKTKSPTGLLLQLVRLNKVTETKLPNGNKVYTSGDYRNVSDAEKFCRDYQTSGFKKARVVKKASVKKGN